MSELATALLHVYAGRRDTYGRQRVETTLDEATGMARRKATWATGIQEPVTEALVDRHLTGQLTIGLYLLDAESRCGFAVLDIDTKDRAPVQLLLRALDEHGIDTLLSDS